MTKSNDMTDMSKQTEAMKLALKALEVATTPFARDRQEVLRAITALRNALAVQPAKQEPLLQSKKNFEHNFGQHWQADWIYSDLAELLGTSLQPAQQQEPKLPEFYARFEDGLVSVYQRREDATPLLLLRENLPDKQPAQQEPVAHCEAGPEHCPVCLAETRSLALAAAVGYVQRNTPQLVSEEICRALKKASPPAKPAQPSKPWVDLTDEEIAQGCKESWVTKQAWQSAVWWAEAKLKEKNT